MAPSAGAGIAARKENTSLNAKRALNFGLYGRARPAKNDQPHSGSLYFAGAEEDGVQLPRAHQMDPDQDVYCSKEPWVVHGSQPPGNVAAREAAQRYKSTLLLNFLRSGHAGRSPAQPVIGNAHNRAR